MCDMDAVATQANDAVVPAGVLGSNGHRRQGVDLVGMGGPTLATASICSMCVVSSLYLEGAVDDLLLREGAARSLRAGAAHGAFAGGRDGPVGLRVVRALHGGDGGEGPARPALRLVLDRVDDARRGAPVKGVGGRVGEVGGEGGGGADAGAGAVEAAAVGAEGRRGEVREFVVRECVWVEQNGW